MTLLNLSVFSTQFALNFHSSLKKVDIGRDSYMKYISIYLCLYTNIYWFYISFLNWISLFLGRQMYQSNGLRLNDRLKAANSKVTELWTPLGGQVNNEMWEKMKSKSIFKKSWRFFGLIFFVWKFFPGVDFQVSGISGWKFWLNCFVTLRPDFLIPIKVSRVKGSAF